MQKITLSQIKQKLQSEEYDFLRDNPHLGNNIIMLTIGGSHSYNLATEKSDLDIRAVSLNSKREILLAEDFEQVTDDPTDTTVYSFNKILKLLISSNPNVIQLLGNKPEHYLYLSDIGRELLDNRKMFLSKICIHTFGNYASSQLRRLENKANRLVGQAQNEAYILKSINNARYDFKNKYFPCSDSSVRLYIDDAVQKGYEKEIFMDVVLNHYPLRDWAGMWNEMKAIVGSYTKIGRRNDNAISHDKLGKHMSCLIYLYMVCVDILEKEEVITYRSDPGEHNLLMDIRQGKYLDGNRQPIPEFYELVNEWEKRFNYAKENTSLPDIPDRKRINEFKMYVNERVVKGEV